MECIAPRPDWESEGGVYNISGLHEELSGGPSHPYRYTLEQRELSGGALISELRKDPVLGRWVIISGERSRRPNPFRHYPTTIEEAGPCPFCPGNEAMTPPEVLAYRG